MYMAGFKRCHSDHSVFIKVTSTGCLILAANLDDILQTGWDWAGIDERKDYLQTHFVTGD